MNYKTFIDMCAYHEMATGKPAETVTMSREAQTDLLMSLPAGVLGYVRVKCSHDDPHDDHRVFIELNGVKIMVKG